MHATDILEIREGLRETDSFITSINSNQSRPVYSLTSQMFLLFKSNDWQSGSLQVRGSYVPSSTGGWSCVFIAYSLTWSGLV